MWRQIDEDVRPKVEIELPYNTLPHHRVHPSPITRLDLVDLNLSALHQRMFVSRLVDRRDRTSALGQVVSIACDFVLLVWVGSR
jgi:hypothetical protein